MSNAIIPYLAIAEADKALAFYAAAFGADVRDVFKDASGVVGFADVRVGDGARFFVSGEFEALGVGAPRPGALTPVSLVLTTPDVDGLAAKAEAAGATIITPPEAQADGARRARLTDPFGHRWIISSPG